MVFRRYILLHTVNWLTYNYGCKSPLLKNSKKKSPTKWGEGVIGFDNFSTVVWSDQHIKTKVITQSVVKIKKTGKFQVKSQQLNSELSENKRSDMEYDSW